MSFFDFLVVFFLRKKNYKKNYRKTAETQVQQQFQNQIPTFHFFSPIIKK